MLNWVDELFPNKEDQPSIYALKKHVKFSKQPLEVRDGKTGQTQLVLLLTHTTTTINVPKMKFVRNGVILHQDGSAPNLVRETIDEDGNLIQWREFNTQVCEQLNTWLAGYESILK